MRGIGGSYRWRRRLVWIGLALAVIGITIGVFVSLPEGGRKFAETFRNETTQVTPEAPPLKVTHAVRRRLTATLVDFTSAAVARKNPEQAWRLATHGLKAGTTLADWRRGQLPVFPYPASPAHARAWTLVGTTSDAVTVDLVFQPPRGSKRGAIEFQADLKPVGTGTSRHWLVDSFIPVRSYPASGGKPTAAPKALPKNFVPTYPKGRLSPLWFLLPGVILSLIVLLPLGIAIRNWRRGVRAERAYRRGTP